MKAFCPDCGSEMEFHPGTNTWHCPKDECNVWSLKRNKQGKIVKVYRVTCPKSLRRKMNEN